LAGQGAFEFVIDRDWRVQSTTPKAAKWAGLGPQELVGVDQHQRAPLKPPLFDAIATAFRTGAPVTAEFPSVLIPGRWVRLQVDPTPENARVGFQDITSQVRAEQPPRATSDLGYPSLNEGPAEIALLDQQGVIRSVNAAWRASVAAHAVKLANDGVGARYVEVCKATLPDLDEVALERELRKLLLGDMPQMDGTYTIGKGRDEQLRHVQIMPLRLGRANYFIAIHEDLTERARVLAALHETSDQLLHAQELERRRIAIELHDSMSQHLAGIVLTVGQIRRRFPGEASVQALLDDLAKLAQQATRETRVLSHLLNASRHEREPLGAALQRLVGGFGSRTGLDTIIETNGPIDATNGAAQHALFRVIQEALTNVYRHAKATKVSVSLLAGADQLSLSIVDDGRGMPIASGADRDAAPLGVGIPGMRSRIEQLGGRLEITSSPGGAVVAATLPLHRSTRAANRGA
jgi:signal transduction histidine kinase